jgi:S-methylmethionine-dependent homocysteine/selenocysteine methylase
MPKQDSVEILDGGTGEELQRLGLPDDRKFWSARALVDPQYHDLVRRVHQNFIRAGSRYITTCNYAVTPTCGLADRIEELTTIAGHLAVNARNKCTQEGYPAVKICGCLPPLGESYRPDLILPREMSLGYYRRIALSLLPFVDIFLAETMSCLAEATWALEGAIAVNANLPLWVSWTVQQNGCLRSGESATDAIRSLLNLPEIAQRLKVISFNCSEPEAITLTLKAIHADRSLTKELKQRDIYLGAYANRLVPVNPDFELANSESAAPTRDDLPPAVYTKFSQQWVKLGAHFVGGCCGVGPQHIRDLSERLISD